MSLKEAAKKRRCKLCFEDLKHLNFSTNAAIFPYKLYYNLLTMQKACKLSGSEGPGGAATEAQYSETGSI